MVNKLGFIVRDVYRRTNLRGRATNKETYLSHENAGLARNTLLRLLHHRDEGLTLRHNYDERGYEYWVVKEISVMELNFACDGTEVLR